MIFYKRFIGEVQKLTSELSCAEQGVFDRLLDHYIAKEERLPGTLERCYRIARAMTEDERQAVDQVLRQFYVLDEGTFRFAWADALLAEAAPRIAAAQANGKLGGRPRKPRPETQTEPTGFPSGNPVGTQQEPSGKASQSQSQSQKDQEKDPPTPRKRGEVFDAGSIALPDWLDRDLWQRWCNYRAEIGKRITEHGAKAQLSQLDKHRAEGKTPQVVLEHAMASGHQGLYPPSPSKSTNGQAPEQPAWSKQLEAQGLNAGRLTGMIARPQAPPVSLAPPSSQQEQFNVNGQPDPRYLLRPPGTGTSQR